jgi:hypothetical protein
MRKLFIYTSIAALVLASGAVLSASAAELPGNLVLEGCGDKQPAVPFDHAKHAEGQTCVSCHHTQPDLTATSGEAATCVSCHKDPTDNDLDCAEMSPKKNPYHINCMGCHKDAVKKDAALKGKAPTTCKGCHIK